MAKRKRKISRTKKLVRVLRRKWFKPALVTLFFAFFIYFSVSSFVLRTRVVTPRPPHFIISRISDTFEQTEFMHLLLAIQEISKIPGAEAELKAFANGPYPAPCPDFLTKQLHNMNWEPQAFLIRVKKLFALYETYDRLQRLDQTISFLSSEIKERRLPSRIREQVKVLEDERHKVMESQLTDEEYQFIDNYAGLIIKLRNY